MVLMKDFYMTNADFKEYVDKYCLEHRTTVEVALKHAVVREAFEYYKNKRF